MSKKKPDNQPKPPAPSRCIDCGALETIARHAYFKAVRPKCSKCGGLLEYTGSWRGSRNNKVVRTHHRGKGPNIRTM